MIAASYLHMHVIPCRILLGEFTTLRTDRYLQSWRHDNFIPTVNEKRVETIKWIVDFGAPKAGSLLFNDALDCR